MGKILFATTNQGKLDEAAKLLDVEVKGVGIEGIEEIQSLDPVEVATRKAQDYFKKLKKAIVVEDVSLVFNSLGQLPGTYINDFSKTLGNDGLINLLKGRKDRRATAYTILVHMDKKGKAYSFVGKMNGEIATVAKGDKGFGWDPIFVPHGANKTLAQMEQTEKAKYSMRAKAFKKLKNWLKENKIN